MTTPKGIVGGFEFTVFQRNLKEWQAGEVMDIYLRVLKQSKKSRFDSIPIPFGIVACTFFAKPFSK